MNNTTGWSEARIETLKTLWGTGLTASRIAEEIGGGLTRNAVIGKIHRLGLSEPRTAAKKLAAKTSPKKPSSSGKNKKTTEASSVSLPTNNKSDMDKKSLCPEPKLLHIKENTQKKDPVKMDAIPGKAIDSAPLNVQSPIEMPATRSDVSQAQSPLPDPSTPPISRGLQVRDLTDKTCKFPHGHPGEKHFGFCGHPTSDGTPYCQYHANKVYNRKPEAAVINKK